LESVVIGLLNDPRSLQLHLPSLSETSKISIPRSFNEVVNVVVLVALRWIKRVEW